MRPRLPFTLIELLVVIAIIAILASMLLPVLGRARKMGQSVACLNNTKQIATALQSQMDDNDGRVPNFEFTPSYSTVFTNLVKGKYIPYDAVTGSQFACPGDTWRTSNSAAPERNAVVKTIAYKNLIGTGYTSDGWDVRMGDWYNPGSDRIRTAYEVNGYVMNGTLPFASPVYWNGAVVVDTTLYPPRPVSGCKYPDLLVMLGDAMESDTGFTGTVWRHPSTTANASFFDGHSENVSPRTFNANTPQNIDGFTINCLSLTDPHIVWQ